jgi:hypothetical protein
MLSDYFSKKAVSRMTFEEFESRFNCNIEIIRHKLTMKEAFVELGGTFKSDKVETKVIKKKKKSFN